MTRIQWDKVGDRRYETGVDRGVLYVRDSFGRYPVGVPWNGLTAVTESPSGADSNKQYADNIEYLNLQSAEQFGATIEAFTYPDEFEECDGTAEIAPGVTIGQQRRKPFGLAFRTLIGNDVDGTDLGYKIKLVYGGLAAPSEKANSTVNDSPAAITFSWALSTTPIDVPGFKPSATITLNSTKVAADKLQQIEDILYGTPGTDPRLPLPEEIAGILAGGAAQVVAATAITKPTQAGNVLTIPTVTGVVYEIDGEPVTGNVTLTEDTVVTARPEAGYKFAEVSDDDWFFAFAG